MAHEHLVMIVDDDTDCRELLAELLVHESYKAVTAANGAEALTVLREHADSVCLILLDLMMPVMNGWEFRREQRADPRIAPIPVIVLTADTQALRHAELHAQALLAKPLEPEKLLSLVPAYCRHQD